MGNTCLFNRAAALDATRMCRGWFHRLAVICASCGVWAAPDYFPSVANQVLRVQGKARIGSDTQTLAVRELEQQVKRVMAADPSLPLNVSSLRDRPDPELLRILLLAVLGNYTSAISQEWGQPCRLVVDPLSGSIQLEDEPPTESIALKVVVVLLVAVQIHQAMLVGT
jgi:hypothetical protein